MHVLLTEPLGHAHNIAAVPLLLLVATVVVSVVSRAYRSYTALRITVTVVAVLTAANTLCALWHQ
jgi:hypothetical protein